MQLKKRLALRVANQLRTFLNHTGLNSISPTAQTLVVGTRVGLIQIHGDKFNVMDNEGLVDVQLGLGFLTAPSQASFLAYEYNQRQLKAILNCLTAAQAELPQFETYELQQMRIAGFKSSGLKMVVNSCNGAFGYPTGAALQELHDKRKACIDERNRLKPVVYEQWYATYKQWLFPKAEVSNESTVPA